MKAGIIIIFVLISSLQFSSPARAFTTYLVGWEIEGRTYNSLSKRWVKSRFTISVGVGADNSSYLFFRTDTSLAQAIVGQRYGEGVQEKLKEVSSKALQWKNVARNPDSGPDEGLGCFGDGDSGLCNEQSLAFGKNQMAMRLVSANGQPQTELVFDLVDQNNISIKTEIHFAEEKINQIAKLIDEIPAAIKRLQRDTEQSPFLK